MDEFWALDSGRSLAQVTIEPFSRRSTSPAGSAMLQAVGPTTTRTVFIEMNATATRLSESKYLEDLGTTVRLGPTIAGHGVSGGHLLRHRQRRIRKKARNRLGPAIRNAVTDRVMEALRASVR